MSLSFSLPDFSSFTSSCRVAVVGAGGTIGAACIEQLLQISRVSQIYAVSRDPLPQQYEGVSYLHADLFSDPALAQLAEEIAEPLDLVIVATGILHEDSGLQPEKRIQQLTMQQYLQVMQVNSFLPLQIARHFLPLLQHRDRAGRKGIFAALSARVGSISDNRLGGWYSYRASKAALNMLLKTLAVEVSRQSPELIICGLHPGTVDSRLSAPYQRNVPAAKLFTPEYAAARLLTVLDQLQVSDSGRVFAWDGQPVPA